MIGLSLLAGLLVGVPSAPTIIKPAMGQVNVSERPVIVWNDTQSEAVTYDLIISTQSSCTPTPAVSRVFRNLTSKSFSLLEGVALDNAQTLYVCVSAKGASGTSPHSPVVTFSTRDASSVETPSLDTRFRGPSGQTQIPFFGDHGEEGARARIFLKSGSQDLEVGSTLIDGNANGSFSVVVDVTTPIEGPGLRSYYAVIERPTAGDPLRSSPSSLVAYNYDPRYALKTPVLQKDGTSIGALQWKLIDSSTSTVYEIYRRIEMQGCSDSNLCFLSKAFSKISSRSLQDASGGFIHFKDSSTEVSALSAGAGVSYFVVATAANGDRSDRSNAISFLDIFAPARSRENVQVVAAKSGRSIQFFYCNIDRNGFLNTDNSPDLTSRVQFFRRPAEGCPTTESAYTKNPANEALGWTQADLRFDALRASTDIGSNIINCVSAGEIIDLEPDTPYCFRVCQQDASGQIERNCSTMPARTLLDSVAPRFDGLIEASPQIDGRSIRVGWNLAKEDQTTREVIQYQIQKTNVFDSMGQPLFKDILNDPEVVLVEGGKTQIVVGNLETGVRYCFQATALDNALPTANRDTPENRWQCASTLDNRPMVKNIRIAGSVADEPYKIRIQFQVLARQAELEGYRIFVESMSYQLGRGEWKPIDKQDLNGNIENLLASSSINSAPDNAIVLNTLPYFSGEQNFSVKIQVRDFLQRADLAGNAVTQPISNTSETESDQTQVFSGMASIGSFQNQSLSGCELNGSRRPETVKLPVLFLLMITGIACLFLREAKRPPRI
jgi:hypothetical protein